MLRLSDLGGVGVGDAASAARRARTIVGDQEKAVSWTEDFCALLVDGALNEARVRRAWGQKAAASPTAAPPERVGGCLRSGKLWAK